MKRHSENSKGNFNHNHNPSFKRIPCVFSICRRWWHWRCTLFCKHCYIQDPCNTRFWVVRIVVLGLTAIPGLVKIAQGVGNEDVRERNGGISLLVIGGALLRQHLRLRLYSKRGRYEKISIFLICSLLMIFGLSFLPVRMQ